MQFSKNKLVGLNGLEPSTSRLSGVRSNQLSYRPICGGGKGIRTLDPLRARQVLSQLSYTPTRFLNNLMIAQNWTEIKKQIFWVRSKHLVTSFLHRKEVIQPQVLLRLPCYDFTPIADPTLGRFLSCESDHALWVLPTLMVWRAVCTRPGNVFTATCWFAITSNSSFM